MAAVGPSLLRLRGVHRRANVRLRRPMGLRLLRLIGAVAAPRDRPEPGRGWGAQALELVTRWAFEHMGVERMEVVIDMENEASQRTAEKAGFTREGVRRGYERVPDHGSPSGPVRSVAQEERAVVDKAERVTIGVGAVEGALTPGTLLDC